MTKFNLIENKEIMKKIHSRLFKILDYFVEICEKNNFVYFLSYGLPLGIFRENKIIDWDIDIDVDMPIDEFDKLIIYLEKNPHPEYVFTYSGNTTNETFVWGFIGSNKTEIITEGNMQNNTKGKIGMDIFPIAKVKNIKESLAMQRFLLSSTAKWLDLEDFTNLEKWNVREKIMRMYENTDTNYYASFEPSINKYIFDKNTIFPLKKIELNGKYYNVVNNLPKYLELIYGSDYMVPKKYDKWIYSIKVDD